MREIKFRAWDKENKKFYDDIFGIDDSGQVILIEQATIWTAPEYVVAKNCIPLQYTGLKDKNGKEIYEGDVVARGKYKYEVVWNERKGWYGIDDGDNGLTVLAQHLDYIEVAGNIYENPELMERKE